MMTTTGSDENDLIREAYKMPSRNSFFYHKNLLACFLACLIAVSSLFFLVPPPQQTEIAWQEYSLPHIQRDMDQGKVILISAMASWDMSSAYHGNQGSCPTGTRFLARSSQPCKRHYSVAGCFMTHLTERCGSLKVAKLKRNFGGIKNEFRLGAAVHTFTVSHFLKDWMIRTGFDASMVHVLKSPAPDRPAPEQAIPNTGKPRFAFLGRLVPQKGVPWLLRALKLVKSDIHVDIAGDGPLHAELEAYCKRNDLQDIVTFHGWVDQQQVRQIMADARGIVFPSVWEEPAGLITLEAAAAGRPVIASKAGGIPEYALDEFSLLVSPNNDQQLADAIDRLAEDHDLAMRMGACGLRNARDRYSMSRFFEKQNTLYELAINEPALALS